MTSTPDPNQPGPTGPFPPWQQGAGGQPPGGWGGPSGAWAGGPPFPPQPPGPYPPGAPAPPPPPLDWKPLLQRPWFWILAVIIVVIVIGEAGEDESGQDADPVADSGEPPLPLTDGDEGEWAEESQPAPAEIDEPSPDTTSPGLGQPAADGDFSFVVHGIDCGHTQLGGQYLNTQAQGQFCIVSLDVTNIGDEAERFSGSDLYLFNAQGQEYSADSGAAFYLDDADSLYELVNPGNTLHSKVVFDVPVDMVPTAIELHDSAFSGGVTVRLE